MNRAVIACCLSCLLFSCKDNNVWHSAIFQSNADSIFQQSKGIIEYFYGVAHHPLTLVQVLDQTNNTRQTAPITAPLKNEASKDDANSSIAAVNIKWQWPAQGNIIEMFSNENRGIDIAGSLGDKIVAAADGKVVYAGNALPGYGNLIIIKHDDDYLTAYGHNQTIFVKEGQTLNAGQQIATMGDIGASSSRLHFEVRYRAKSVDPLNYLPKQ